MQKPAASAGFCIFCLFIEQLQILAIPLFCQFFLGNEPEGGRINAIPQPGGLGTVGKDMAEVGV
jgi:hypothetical protein